MIRERSTTSLQRTYRYLRIAIAGAVVVVFTAILAVVPHVGLLPSISHYYYTPAGPMFVGALLAVAVSFLALSGRGAERVLLDVAAVLIPLVAIVPTTVSPGSVPGADEGCRGGAAVCVPAAYRAVVDAGILTYLVVGLLVVLLAVGLTIAGEVDRDGAALSIGIAGALLLAVGLAWWLVPDVFLRWAHLISAAAFFGVIAAVAALNAVAPAARDTPRWLRGAYVSIAVALALVVLGMPFYGGLHAGPVFGVFVGEVAALVLFAAFWVLQSVHYWRADDPAIIARG